MYLHLFNEGMILCIEQRKREIEIKNNAYLGSHEIIK